MLVNPEANYKLLWTKIKTHRSTTLEIQVAVDEFNKIQEKINEMVTDCREAFKNESFFLQ